MNSSLVEASRDALSGEPVAVLRVATPFATLYCHHCSSGVWADGPCVFMFVEPGKRILYVGFSDNEGQDLRAHSRWADAVALGATAIYAGTVSTAPTRSAVEQWLVACFAPPVNAATS